MKWVTVSWAWTDPLWEDNIKIDLQEVGWGGMDSIDLAHDRDR